MTYFLQPSHFTASLENLWKSFLGRPHTVLVILGLTSGSHNAFLFLDCFSLKFFIFFPPASQKTIRSQAWILRKVSMGFGYDASLGNCGLSWVSFPRTNILLILMTNNDAHFTLHFDFFYCKSMQFLGS